MLYLLRFSGRIVLKLATSWSRLVGHNRLYFLDLTLWLFGGGFLAIWFWFDGFVIAHIYLLMSIVFLMLCRWFIATVLPVSVPPLVNDPKYLKPLLDKFSSELAELIPQLETQLKEFFDLSGWKADDYRQLTVHDVANLKQAWWKIILTMKRLETVRRRFSRFFELADHRYCFRALLISYTAQMQILATSLAIMERVNDHKFVEEILDDQELSLGLLPDNYQRLVRNTLHISELFQAYLYAIYFQDLKVKHSLKDSKLGKYLSLAILFVIDSFVRIGYWNAFNSTRRLVRRESFRLIFPIQKNLAEAIGNTRLAVRSEYLIGRDDIFKMYESLEPLDLITTRSAWYLSNAWLPGFWTHVIVYLGEPERFINYFELDSDVLNYIQESYGHKSLKDLLDKHHPLVWSRWKESEDGFACNIIEAVAQGVIIRPLEVACEADYAASIRPRISKVEKLKIVLEMFGHFGKPYDFNFDYTIDSALGCSELVYKSFNKHVSLPVKIKQVSGRLTLPVHEFLRSFARERGFFTKKPKNSRHFWDFVFFLDGRPRLGHAEWRDEKAYLKSVGRTRWD